MQHHSDADTSPEVFRIGGDGEQSLGGGLEQEIIDHRFVLIGDIADLGRQSEYDMVILDWQQFGLACFKPPLGCRGLALGAMPVATGNGELPITCLMGSTS